MFVKAKLLAPMLTVGAIVFGSITAISQSSLAQARVYFCNQSRDGVPTTYGLNATGKPIALIRWERDWNRRFSPEERCQAVSERFQDAYDDGVLNYLTRGVMSGQNVICAARRYGGACDAMLLTLRAGENPEVVLQQLVGLGNRASGPIVQSEDGSTRSYYEMTQFLDKPPLEESLEE